MNGAPRYRTPDGPEESTVVLGSMSERPSVSVPAEKLPELSRETIVLAVLLDVAFVVTVTVFAVAETLSPLVPEMLTAPVCPLRLLKKFCPLAKEMIPVLLMESPPMAMLPSPPTEKGEFTNVWLGEIAGICPGVPLERKMIW
jgi:hypothetical protein